VSDAKVLTAVDDGIADDPEALALPPSMLQLRPY